jgi:hypothetical protein
VSSSVEKLQLQIQAVLRLGVHTHASPLGPSEEWKGLRSGGGCDLGGSRGAGGGDS